MKAVREMAIVPAKKLASMAFAKILVLKSGLVCLMPFAKYMTHSLEEQ